MVKDNIILKFSPLKVSTDGVITDSRTGLEWAPVPNKDMNWGQANQYAQSLSLAGGGWRLPTRVELRGLFETGKTGCGIAMFNVTNKWVWSSELCNNYGSPGARVSYVNDGDDKCTSRDNATPFGYGSRVLAVRSRR